MLTALLVVHRQAPPAVSACSVAMFVVIGSAGSFHSEDGLLVPEFTAPIPALAAARRSTMIPIFAILLVTSVLYGSFLLAGSQLSP